MARACIVNTIKIQACVVVFVLFLAPEILHMLGLAPIHRILLNIDMVSTGLLVLLIGLTNLLYYLNRKKEPMIATIVLFITNLTLTLASFWMGPMFFGYGFVIALLLANTVAMLYLIHAFKKLTYRSFMLA